MPWETSVTPGSTHYWLIHPDDEAKNMQLHQVVSDSMSEEYQQESFVLLGRPGRKVDYGDRMGREGSLSAQLRDRPGYTARQQRQDLEELRAERRELFLRNPFGDVWQVSTGNLQISRVPGVGAHEYVDISIPYTEVA